MSAAACIVLSATRLTSALAEAVHWAGAGTMVGTGVSVGTAAKCSDIYQRHWHSVGTAAKGDGNVSRTEDSCKLWWQSQHSMMLPDEGLRIQVC